MVSRFAAFTFSLVLFAMVLPGKLAALELVMYEQEYCEWCEKWDEEVGVVYPKTTEGKAAPLRKVDIFEEIPEDLKKFRKPRFTPTFVLLDDGKEVGRIRGYPGEDFFWGMLGELINKARKNAKTKAVAPSAS